METNNTPKTKIFLYKNVETTSRRFKLYFYVRQVRRFLSSSSIVLVATLPFAFWNPRVRFEILLTGCQGMADYQFRVE